MKIRAQQMDELKRAALRRFEDEMVQHMKEFSPRHCEVIGEPGVREVIRLGMQRAREHGLTNRGAVRFYIEMMFMFGSDFDTDPQYPWAAEALDAERTPNQNERADRLHAKTIDYLKNVAGPDNEYALDAMRRTRRASEADLIPPGQTLRSATLERMKSIYPQKCAYVGDAPLRALIQHGMKLAKEHSVSTDESAALFIVLMFALGHGAAADPLFPWISATLNDRAVADPEKRVDRLRRKAITYLDRALGHLERR